MPPGPPPELSGEEDEGVDDDRNSDKSSDSERENDRKSKRSLFDLILICDFMVY